MKTLAAAFFSFLCFVPLARSADIATLVRQLKSEDAEERRAAAKGLAEMGSEAKSAVGALATALKDKDLFVRRFSAQALGEIGPEAKSAVRPLAEALKDSRKEVAQAAAVALGKVGGDGVGALALFVGDKGKDPEARRKAAEALGSLGANAKSAVPGLTAALKDRDVRLEAANALGEIGPDAKGALKELETIAASKERDRVFTQAVNRAIKKIKK